jgi:hypothetical protein
MSLRNGFFVNSKRMIYALTEGSPYAIELDEDSPLAKLGPGYYDMDLKPVTEDIALAPDDA